MKIKYSALLILFIPLFHSTYVYAQPQQFDFDSTAISKPKRMKFLYKFQDPFLSSVSISSGGTITKQKVPGENFASFTGDLVVGAYGPILGSVNSTKEVICHPVGILKCNDTSLDWKIRLACPGLMNTEKEKSDDGVSVRRTAVMFWKERAEGIITEGNDTICVFDIISEPDTNSILNPWNEVVYSNPQTRYPVPEEKKIMNYRMDNLFESYEDYGIIGTFRGEDFALLYNCKQGESWLYGPNGLKMIFYADIDDFLYVPKKDRLVPFIMWYNSYSNSEKHDLIRLAMASRYLTKILSVGYYPLN